MGGVAKRESATEAGNVKDKLDVGDRFAHYAASWGVVIQRTVETRSAIVGFGFRMNEPVVIKVARENADEWQSGSVLQAFGGHGVARIIEHVPGAVLLEELRPGVSLVGVTQDGRDREAVEIVSQVIRDMQLAAACLGGFPTVEEWGRTFRRSYEVARGIIPIDLLDEAEQRYTELCNTQVERRLLHGDLHHYNILYDVTRGWVAIDPKGVVGEVAYEIGATLRNPADASHLTSSPAEVERRITQFAGLTGCGEERIAGWAFAQAVLSAIWTVEDGDDLEHAHYALGLAATLRPMLNR
jgi:streptomycin 6-kinase